MYCQVFQCTALLLLIVIITPTPAHAWCWNTFSHVEHIANHEYCNGRGTRLRDVCSQTCKSCSFWGCDTFGNGYVTCTHPNAIRCECNWRYHGNEGMHADGRCEVTPTPSLSRSLSQTDETRTATFSPNVTLPHAANVTNADDVFLWKKYIPSFDGERWKSFLLKLLPAPLVILVALVICNEIAVFCGCCCCASGFGAVSTNNKNKKKSRPSVRFRQLNRDVKITYFQEFPDDIPDVSKVTPADVEDGVIVDMDESPTIPSSPLKAKRELLNKSADVDNPLSPRAAARRVRQQIEQGDEEMVVMPTQEVFSPCSDTATLSASTFDSRPPSAEDSLSSPASTLQVVSHVSANVSPKRSQHDDADVVVYVDNLQHDDDPDDMAARIRPVAPQESVVQCDDAELEHNDGQQQEPQQETAPTKKSREKKRAAHLQELRRLLFQQSAPAAATVPFPRPSTSHGGSRAKSASSSAATKRPGTALRK